MIRFLLMFIGSLLATFSAPKAQAAIFSPGEGDIPEEQIGIGVIGGALSGTGITQTSSFGDLIIKYVNFFLPYLTLAAFVALVYSGFLYVFAFGNDDQIQKAKKIMIWAVVGIVLVIISYTVVQFFTKALVEQL